MAKITANKLFHWGKPFRSFTSSNTTVEELIIEKWKRNLSKSILKDNEEIDRFLKNEQTIRTSFCNKTVSKKAGTRVSEHL